MKAEVTERNRGEVTVREGCAEMRLTISPSEALALIADLTFQLMKKTPANNILDNCLHIDHNKPYAGTYHAGSMHISIDHNSTW